MPVCKYNGFSHNQRKATGVFFDMNKIFKAGYSRDEETFYKEADNEPVFCDIFDSLENAISGELCKTNYLEEFYICIVENEKNEKGEFIVPVSRVEIIKQNL